MLKAERVGTGWYWDSEDLDNYLATRSAPGRRRSGLAPVNPEDPDRERYLRAKRAYQKALRQELNKRLDNARHGIPTTYTNAGCRCILCTAAQNRKQSKREKG